MKPQQPQIEHTAQFSRRNLFPCEGDTTTDDLGCISPLNFDSDDGTPQNFTLKKHCVGDYDIIGLVEKNETDKVIQTPNNPLIVFDKVLTPCTVVSESPTQKLKTPHDTCDNSKFPKLIRKTQVETSPESPCKNPKVRTALFPEVDMSLPSRTFYPKSQGEISPRGLVVRRKTSPRRSTQRQSLFLCNRRSRIRSGQINAGVRHKIKKPKFRKINKLAVLQAAINIIENSPLNSILDESVELQPEPPPKDPTPSPEPDPNKKFFKSSRHKGVVNIISNIKIEMNNGKMNLIDTCNKTLKRRRNVQEASPSCKKVKLMGDFDNVDQTLIPQHDVCNVISCLEEEKENNSKVDPMALMSPTSQMCNMTSGLALNSPKKARDLSSVLEAMPNNNKEQGKKLFPVFYPGRTSIIPTRADTSKNSSAKKFRALSKDQLLLDAGQKRFGATQCPECKIIYHMGDPGDEIMHINYHNAGHIFRFTGWKNERVVSDDFLDGKIIQIIPGDSKIWWKKVKEVIEVVNRDLGFYEMEYNTATSQIFFYIKNRVIVGALVAEPKNTAYKLLTKPQDQVDLCSEESYSIKCGVSRIWVAQNHRKKGVATALMNALKRNFVYGYILNNEDIAFSSPTELGKLFGQKYFKTPNFFIYFI